LFNEEARKGGKEETMKRIFVYVPLLLMCGALAAVVVEPLPVANGVAAAQAELPRAAISPSIVRLEPGGQCQFSIKLKPTGPSGQSGDSAGVASWTLKGMPDGGAEFGTITDSGLYTAPARIPRFNEICIMATLEGVANQYAWATVLLGSKDPEYTLVNCWGENGKGPGQFTDPHGITVGTDGNLVVTDSAGHRVYRFTRDGKFLGELIPAEGPFQGPRAAVEDASGNIYVADGTWNRIVKFSPDGKTIASWGKSGSGPGDLNRPHGIAIGQHGQVYVPDVDNHRIQVYDSSGKFLFQVGGTTGQGQGYSLRPHGIDSDPSGNIFFNEYNGIIHKFSADGTHLLTFTARVDIETTTCHMMACDNNGNFYLCARVDKGQRGLILKYNNEGDFITSFVAPSKPGQVFMPHHCAIDEEGRVYATEIGRGRRCTIEVLEPGSPR